ncbi:Kelch repeat-containing protein [Brevundimonas sp. FT23028]|uniref:Kelch repeat-containing protein n=1 Tax=Brevundimonas sp. FT23028 TaxID=3393748 RepID=UPI003B58A8D8
MTHLDRRTLIAAGAALGLVPAAARAQAEPVGRWTSRASLPWIGQEIYAAVWNGKIVTAGGLVMRRGQPLHVEDRVAAYDPAADVWSELPRLPEARHHPMVMVAGGELNIVGGYARTEAGEWVNTTTAWALKDGGWVEAARLPTPQAEAVGAGMNGRLHLIGGRTPEGEANAGWNDQTDTDRHRVRVDGRWETARPAPVARNSAAAAVLDGAIWVAGGRTVSGGGTGRLDRYDPAADRWDTLAPIPRSDAQNSQVGGGLAMAEAGGRLVAFGGEWFAPGRSGGGGGVFAETWIYDPARDAWTAGPDMKTPRHGLAAASVDGAVYAIAGGSVVSGGQAVGVVERFGG